MIIISTKHILKDLKIPNKMKFEFDFTRVE